MLSYYCLKCKKKTEHKNLKAAKQFIKSLLAGDQYMPKMYLRQPGFTYSACGPFTKSKERIQTFT